MNNDIKFKQHMYTHLAYLVIGEEDKEFMRKVFQNMDKNKDGTITLDELK